MNITSVSMNSFRAKLPTPKEVTKASYRAYDELIPETTKNVAESQNKSILEFFQKCDDLNIAIPKKENVVDKFIKSDVNIESVAKSTKKDVPFINESSIM